MKLFIIIIGVVTVAGSVVGVIFALIHEIRKEQKAKLEEQDQEPEQK